MTASLDATLTASRTPAGLSARYVIPISDDGFFVTTSGKIQRGAFQQAFRAGVYSRAVRALDLALATSPFAAPDFFATPVWVRKEPPLTALPPGACGTGASASASASPSGQGSPDVRGREGTAMEPLPGRAGARGRRVAVWLAPEAAHSHVQAAWSTHDPALTLVLVDPLGSPEGWDRVAAEVAEGVRLIVHDLMRSAACGEASAAAAGGGAASLCDLARVLAQTGDACGAGSLKLLVLRFQPPHVALGGSAGSDHGALEGDGAGARAEYALAGAALVPGLCKAIKSEHAAVHAASVVDVPPCAGCVCVCVCLCCVFTVVL